MKFDLHSIEEAPEQSKPLLEKAEEEFGMVPNLLKEFSESPAALEGYMTLSKLLGDTAFTPVEQQLLILAISVENECHYCVAAHSMALRQQLQADDAIIDAVRNGDQLPDEKLNTLVTYVQTVVSERGFVSDETIQEFLNAGYTKRHVLEVNLAIAMKTLSNYTNHMAATPVDEPMQNETMDFQQKATA